jgi:hypothetical protein
VFKKNTWAWLISLCLHAIVIYFLLSQNIKIINPQAHKAQVMNAYVTVNLASKPSQVKTTTNAPTLNKAIEQPNDKPTNESLAAPIKNNINVPMVNKNVHVNKTTKPIKHNKIAPPVVKPLVIPPTKKEPTIDTGFKKLNPYTPIRNLKVNNLQHRRMVDFGRNESTSNDEPAIQTPTIKSPVKTDKSEVVNQNVTGTQRLEKFNGKCYLIDTFTVFGSNGLPQGTGKPCPEEKTHNEILFDEIMKKRLNNNKTH